MNAIFENARRNSTLTIDIEEILKNANTDLTTTQTEITAEIMNAINSYNPDEICALNTKLREYRVITKVFEIQRGKHIRWLRPPSATLTVGGMVVEIKFTDDGTHILCKNRNRFIQIKMDECIIFQRLSHDEQLVLMAYDFLNSV